MPTSVSKNDTHAVLWTLYDYDTKLDNLRAYLNDNCDYAVFGYETCPTTQRPHLQGYLHWKNARTYPNKALRKAVPGIHDQIANGSPEANRKYCLKIRPGDVPNTKFEEFGTIS